MQDDVFYAVSKARLTVTTGLKGYLCAGPHRYILVIFLALALFAPDAGLAGESLSIGGPKTSKPILSWDTEAGKSYLIPALEIPTFIFLLNGLDRLVYFDEIEGGEKEYNSTLSTTWEHLVHGRWGIDQDNFFMNQFLHPYQGVIFHGIARSNGLSYWESSAYTLAGSFLWELAGETTPPSVNDLIASGIGGSFFGEPLFRMANLLLESDGGKPGFWHELGAALLSPPVGFNRLVFGERSKSLFPSHDPATFLRLRIGVNLNTNRDNDRKFGAVNSSQVTADGIMDYGLPGKPGSRYTRPFDYFHFAFSAIDRGEKPIENVMIHGLLWGNTHEAGNSYRSVWGLYGGYDYLSPDVFRVSSTSVSFGTTFQWWLVREVALQGSVLGGIGYAAAGSIAGPGERDYHYGVTPQGLLALRLIFGDRAMLDLTGHEFYVSSMGATESGTENIVRLNAGLTVRIYDRHALGVRYIVSNRDMNYSNLAERHQTMGTYSLFYTFLSDTKFGAVEWREKNAK
ncbi:MAG: DUF3943 domain-containing protein [Syntrophus sp. (in: bacteria)]|nr:DUF3943 domain-containing protein [Syntrophus sp. (in: bacteria)]